MSNPITPVGPFYSAAGTDLTHLAVTPAAVGDCLVVWACMDYFQGAPHYSAVSGGGVTTWTRVASEIAFLGTWLHLDMWFGTVTTAGAATVSFATSGAHADAASSWLAAQEFSGGTVWAVDGTQSGVRSNTVNSTTIGYPALTPGGANRLYVGGQMCLYVPSATGQTPGYTTQIVSGNVVGCLWNASVGTPQSPATKQASAGPSVTMGALITAS